MSDRPDERHQAAMTNTEDSYRLRRVRKLQAENADLRQERDYHRARADVFAEGLGVGKGGEVWAEYHRAHCGAARAAARMESQRNDAYEQVEGLTNQLRFVRGAYEAAREQVRELADENAALRASITELAPADEVLVKGSFFQRNDLPRILGNFMRSSEEYAREAKEARIALDAAREQVRQRDEVIERVRALVDEWSRQGSFTDPFPERVVLDVDAEIIEPLRAALEGASDE